MLSAVIQSQGIPPNGGSIAATVGVNADITAAINGSVSGLATVATTGAYSDLINKPTLGTAAAQNVGAFATAAQGAKADSALQPSGNGSSLTGITAAQVGAATTAQGAKADSAVQPSAAVLTGTPTAPTASPGTNTTQIATTAFVQAALPYAISTADLTGQSGAVASVLAVTSPNDGSAHQYRIGAYANVTAITLDVFQVQVSYTDENSNSATATFFPQGLTSANIAATGNFPFPPMDIRVKANTAITVKTILTTGTGSVTYDVGANIQRLN